MSEGPAIRVLVVDDSKIVRSVLAGYLCAAGYEVSQAENGAEALARMEKDPFDVVLTDLQMPVLDGFGLLEGMKARSVDAEVIVLTANEDMESAVRALRFGAHDFLKKPPSGPEEVVLTVERAGEKKRLRQANARLMAELEALGRRDALTGLYNRRAFDETLLAETARARRYRTPLSLALFNLDHFKVINDEHGHPAGDSVLKVFANLASAQLRDGDVLCRYGGEEFAAILPHAPPAGALDAARRFVSAIAAAPILVGETRVILTVSAGVACLQPSDDGGLLMVAAADGALYEAKRAGRNRAVAA